MGAAGTARASPRTAPVPRRAACKGSPRLRGVGGERLGKAAGPQERAGGFQPPFIKGEAGRRGEGIRPGGRSVASKEDRLDPGPWGGAVSCQDLCRHLVVTGAHDSRGGARWALGLGCPGRAGRQVRGRPRPRRHVEQRFRGVFLQGQQPAAGSETRTL